LQRQEFQIKNLNDFSGKKGLSIIIYNGKAKRTKNKKKIVVAANIKDKRTKKIKNDFSGKDLRRLNKK